MTLHTNKDLESKNVRGKKIQKENMKSKPKKFPLVKGLFIWVTQIQAVESKTLRLFTK